MNGLNAGNNAHRNPAARRVVVVARAVAVDKAEAVPVVTAVKVADAQAAREARVVVDVRVASAALRRAPRPGSQPKCPNKTRPLTAHGVCGRG